MRGHFGAKQATLTRLSNRLHRCRKHAITANRRLSTKSLRSASTDRLELFIFLDFQTGPRQTNPVNDYFPGSTQTNPAFRPLSTKVGDCPGGDLVLQIIWCGSRLGARMLALCRPHGTFKDVAPQKRRPIPFPEDSPQRNGVGVNSPSSGALPRVLVSA